MQEELEEVRAKVKTFRAALDNVAQEFNKSRLDAQVSVPNPVDAATNTSIDNAGISMASVDLVQPGQKYPDADRTDASWSQIIQGVLAGSTITMAAGISGGLGVVIASVAAAAAALTVGVATNYLFTELESRKRLYNGSWNRIYEQVKEDSADDFGEKYTKRSKEDEKENELKKLGESSTLKEWSAFQIERHARSLATAILLTETKSNTWTKLLREDDEAAKEQLKKNGLDVIKTAFESRANEFKFHRQRMVSAFANLTAYREENSNPVPNPSNAGDRNASAKAALKTHGVRAFTASVVLANAMLQPLLGRTNAPRLAVEPSVEDSDKVSAAFAQLVGTKDLALSMYEVALVMGEVVVRV